MSQCLKPCLVLIQQVISPKFTQTGRKTPHTQYVAIPQIHCFACLKLGSLLHSVCCKIWEFAPSRKHVQQRLLFLRYAKTVLKQFCGFLDVPWPAGDRTRAAVNWPNS